MSVAIVDGFQAGFSDSVTGPGRSELEDSDCRAVMRVFTTQIGFVMRTVALPAMAPAIMDSRVVSFWEARVRRAAREKKARVHSYPVRIVSKICVARDCEERTVVVHEVGDRDTEQCAIQTRIEPRDPFSLNNTAHGIVGGGLSALRLDLGSGGECD